MARRLSPTALEAKTAAIVESTPPDAAIIASPASSHISQAILLAKNNIATIPALSTKYPINKNKGTAVKTVLSIMV